MTGFPFDKTACDLLADRRVAVIGATGGLGKPLCAKLLSLGAKLVLIGRSAEKLTALKEELLRSHPAASVELLPWDLEEGRALDRVVSALTAAPPDVLIHNAGAYLIPRRITDGGVDNVFQINCLMPYMLTERLLPVMRSRGGRVVVVGSIAHRYGKIRPSDTQRLSCRSAAKVYGNAKRHLMLAMYERFREETGVTLSVVHPGITLTNITAHYPPWLYALIKPLMKVLFMSPAKAARSLLLGVFEPCGYGEWIGPRIADIWGNPQKRTLRSFSPTEAAAAHRAVQKTAEEFSLRFVEK